MLNIFSKKTFLVDLLFNFTDMHNHLLPGIDDGAESVKKSITLISAMKELGFSGSISTPHTMNDYYPNTPATITNAKEELANTLVNVGIDFKLSCASEYMMDGHFLDILDKKEILPLKENYILVEMSYLQPPLNLEEIIFEISKNDFIPVLAHPERYNFFHATPQKYELLKQRGCKFQLNMLSLSNYYGSSTKKTAYKLIEDGYYDFIGSDIHHERHIINLKNLKIKNKSVEQLIDKTKEIFSF